MTKPEMTEGARWEVVGSIISKNVQQARNGETNGRAWSFPERDVLGIAFHGGTEYVEIEKPHQQALPEVGAKVRVSGGFRSNRGRVYHNDPKIEAL